MGRVGNMTYIILVGRDVLLHLWSHSHSKNTRDPASQLNYRRFLTDAAGLEQKIIRGRNPFSKQR